MRLNAPIVCLVLAISALIAPGCTSLSSSVMVPGKFEIEETFGGSVRIETVGSAPQMMIGSRLIPADELKDAVREVVLNSHLFESVVDEGEADHILIVEFERMKEPEVGLDAECTLSLRWILKDGATQRTIWEKTITTDERVNSFQQNDPAKRSLAVMEKTIRANLEKGVKRLSRSLSKE